MAFRGQIALPTSPSPLADKLIHYGRGGPFAEPPWRWELYDLIDDPSESNDLAAVHPEIVQQMAEHLAEWNESVRACLERLSHHIVPHFPRQAGRLLLR